MKTPMTFFIFNFIFLVLEWSFLENGCLSPKATIGLYGVNSGWGLYWCHSCFLFFYQRSGHYEHLSWHKSHINMLRLFFLEGDMFWVSYRLGNITTKMKHVYNTNTCMPTWKILELGDECGQDTAQKIHNTSLHVPCVYRHEQLLFFLDGDMFWISYRLRSITTKTNHVYNKICTPTWKILKLGGKFG